MYQRSKKSDLVSGLLSDDAKVVMGKDSASNDVQSQYNEGGEEVPTVDIDIPGIDQINKPSKKLNVCIVGYGPAGVTTAIGLSRLGHQVTMYEKSFYNFRDKNARKQNLDLIYPVNIGAKGMWVMEWLRCKPIFDHHLNQFDGILDDKDQWLPWKEPRPCYIGSHLEIMWAFQHAQEVAAPGVKVYQNSQVTKIDVTKSEVTIEGGENSGTHHYDLIIGADGAGSVVRKCMAEQVSDFKAEKFTGNHCVKNIYLDNKEKVKDYVHPNYGYGRSMLGYLTIFAAMKCENNETGIGIIHVGGAKETKTIAETRAWLHNVSPEVNLMMTDESVEKFMNQKPRNIHKSVKCNRYYNGSNVVLIGDAAHPFRPIGQGINLALIGAKLFCEQMANHPHDIDTAISRYNEFQKLQSDPCTFFADNIFKKKHFLREFLSKNLGLQHHMIFAQMKHHLWDFNYDFGKFQTSMRAYTLLKQLFLFMSVMTFVAFGMNWLEAVKVFFMNLFLIMSFCFFKIANDAKPMMCPGMIFLCAGVTCLCTLNSVRTLIFPNEGSEVV